METTHTQPSAPPVAIDLPANFWAKVEITDACWLWTGAKTADGYGNFQGQYPHRLLYEAEYGPIPERLQLDHLCRVRHCCRPTHLEAVTPRENGRRGIKGILTSHCPRGHEYTTENTAFHPKAGRHCRTCDAARHRKLVSA